MEMSFAVDISLFQAEQNTIPPMELEMESGIAKYGRKLMNGPCPS